MNLKPLLLSTILLLAITTITSCHVIDTRSIRLGMSAKQVIEVWGVPRHINSTTGSWGIHEQAIWFSLQTGKEYYLYFENGILTSWQE